MFKYFLYKPKYKAHKVFKKEGRNSGKLYLNSVNKNFNRNNTKIFKYQIMESHDLEVTGYYCEVIKDPKKLPQDIT